LQSASRALLLWKQSAISSIVAFSTNNGFMMGGRSRTADKAKTIGGQKDHSVRKMFHQLRSVAKTKMVCLLLSFATNDFIPTSYGDLEVVLHSSGACTPSFEARTTLQKAYRYMNAFRAECQKWRGHCRQVRRYLNSWTKATPWAPSPTSLHMRCNRHGFGPGVVPMSESKRQIFLPETDVIFLGHIFSEASLRHQALSIC
jgi:hypothetical protein